MWSLRTCSTVKESLIVQHSLTLLDTPGAFPKAHFHFCAYATNYTRLPLNIILTVPFPCSVADTPYSCSVRIRNGLYRRLIGSYKIRDFTSPVMFYSRVFDLRFRCGARPASRTRGSRGIDQLGTLPCTNCVHNLRAADDLVLAARNIKDRKTKRSAALILQAFPVNVCRYYIVSFPDRIFRARRKNGSGQLPIPFSFKCAGMLAHCSFLI